jgi:SAM-dependent methyltransferase
MKMYEELAEWWPLLSAPEEYEEEAGGYARRLAEACGGQIGSVLELGSGGGNNASHMKKLFRLVLVEPSAGMRGISEVLNPECEHVAGDMRSIRLNREFDGVFVHDAVCYMRTPDDLRQAIETAFVHTRPGGAALFAPDYVRETFKPGTDCGGHDGATRGLRYLEWVWDPNPDDGTYLADYVLALREPDGRVHVEHDRHVEGLFSRAEWLEMLSAAGFVAEGIPFEHSELEPGSYEIFIARRPV